MPEQFKPFQEKDMVRYSESKKELRLIEDFMDTRPPRPDRNQEPEEKQESKENLSEEMKIARFYADRLTGAPDDPKTLTYLAHAKKDLEAMQNTKDIVAFDLLRQVIAQYEPEN